MCWQTCQQFDNRLLRHISKCVAHAGGTDSHHSCCTLACPNWPRCANMSVRSGNIYSTPPPIRLCCSFYPPPLLPNCTNNPSYVIFEQNDPPPGEFSKDSPATPPPRDHNFSQTLQYIIVSYHVPPLHACAASTCPPPSPRRSLPGWPRAAPAGAACGQPWQRGRTW
jgi:hypothetical protein